LIGLAIMILIIGGYGCACRAGGDRMRAYPYLLVAMIAAALLSLAEAIG
jgi:hypothetical protein